jgi:hypothetical protein
MCVWASLVVLSTKKWSVYHVTVRLSVVAIPVIMKSKVYSDNYTHCEQVLASVQAQNMFKQG